MERVKPELGRGPMTAPSVQHVAHFHVAVVLPVASFQSCTSLSSSFTTTAGGAARFVRPVLVKVMAILRPLAGLSTAGLAWSRPMIRYTFLDVSMTA